MEFIRNYLQALERFVTGEELAAFYTEDAIQDEYPNAFTPGGARRDVKQILEAAERGKSILVSQTFEVHNLIEQGDRVAVEILWTGVMKTGAEMKARFGIFMELRNGRIARQRNYDCKL